MAKEGKHASQVALVKMRMVFLDCKATIGQVGNYRAREHPHGKAGRNDGWVEDPTFRGVRMNPV